MPKTTTPFDPLDSPETSNDSGGGEVPYDREMVIGELLALEFDDDKPYTRGELDKMSDDQLIDLYDSEMFSDESEDDDDAEEDADEKVKCSVCGVTKVCDFEDEDGEPICAECEESADSPGEDDEVEEIDSETDEESEEDSDEDDVDESEEE